MPIPVRHTPAPPRRFNPRTRMVRRSNGRRTSPGRPARGSRTPRQPSAVPSIGPLPNAAVAAGLLLADGPSAAPDHSTETDQTSSPSTARSSSVGATTPSVRSTQHVSFDSSHGIGDRTTTQGPERLQYRVVVAEHPSAAGTGNVGASTHHGPATGRATLTHSRFASTTYHRCARIT